VRQHVRLPVANHPACYQSLLDSLLSRTCCSCVRPPFPHLVHLTVVAQRSSDSLAAGLDFTNSGLNPSVICYILGWCPSLNTLALSASQVSAVLSPTILLPPPLPWPPQLSWLPPREGALSSSLWTPLLRAVRPCCCPSTRSCRARRSSRRRNSSSSKGTGCSGGGCRVCVTEASGCSFRWHGTRFHLLHFCAWLVESCF
jgi:hypothetical protein